MRAAIEGDGIIVRELCARPELMSPPAVVDEVVAIGIIAQSDIVTAVTPFVASLNGGPDPSGTLSSDTDILNVALLLEFLEAEFYNTNVPKFYGTAGQG